MLLISLFSSSEWNGLPLYFVRNRGFLLSSCFCDLITFILILILRVDLVRRSGMVFRCILGVDFRF